MDYLFKTNYKIRSTEKDLNDHFAPWSILELFQEVSNLHVESEKIGFNDLLTKNALWVLIGIRFQIISDVKDNCDVYTWQAKKGRAEFIRNYLITKGGCDLVIGSSRWCLIDKDTRKILPSSIIDNDITNTFIEIDPPTKLRFSNLKEVKENVKIKKSMIDRNHHLNNCIYAKLIYDAIDLDNKIIKSFEINFINEALLNDEIEIRSELDNGSYLIEGYINHNLICFKAKVEVCDAL